MAFLRGEMEGFCVVDCCSAYVSLGEKRMGGRGVRRVQLLHGVDIEKRLRTSFKLKSGPNVQKRGILVPLTVFYLIYLLKKSVI
jgi:hypothetical protein